MYGKPKLFFIQACQGADYSKATTNIDSTGKLSSDACWDSVKKLFKKSKVKKDDVEEVCELFKFTTDPDHQPDEKDQLIFGCSYQNCFSIRETDKGSWFIQDLCSVMNAQWNKKDFRTMLDQVKNEVSNRAAIILTKVNATEEIKANIFKQMPCEISTLGRKIKFYP